ncbi:MAG TPA: short-chain fatty acyl-CoA regulator family protein [Stellaceae bacterium]|nr:short-chain fatty acyl-CoA regulator family protein [Stellaceae bacterium]
MAARKTLLGQKIRRLRQDRGLTQQQMAAELGISASYLNLIEHDERPVTVSLLLKLGEKYGVDLNALTDDAERQLAAALREVFADAGLRDSGIDADEIARLVGAAPRAARAIADLYRALRAARDDAQAINLNLAEGRTRRVVLPTEEARDFFESRRNHFAALETAAETLLQAVTGDLGRALGEQLARRHGVTVEIATIASMAGALRRFDPRARRLDLSEALPLASRNFHLAYQLGLLEAREPIGETIQAAKLSAPESEMLCRIGLANYFAGAVLMPYATFLSAAQTERYDIERLMNRFGVSFEQVAHRLSTLNRTGAAGIPFFFARADIAGNVSKRFSAAGFHFSRYGGACPRFVVHEAFATPGLIRRQIARLPDGTTFFCVARTVEKPGGGFHAPSGHMAVVLGCDIGRAAEIVYADGLDLTRPEPATEIGVGCRLCERADCRQRAFPPLQHRLVVDEAVKGPSAYAFQPQR